MARVLQLTEAFAAGVYLYIKDLTHCLENSGNLETTIVYSGKRTETEAHRFKKDFTENISLQETSMDREINILKDLKSLIALIRIFKEVKPNIIHCHSSKAGILGRVAAVFYPKATVFYTPHGYAFLREDVSNLKKKIFWIIEKIAAVLLPGVIVACGDTEYEYSKKLGKSLLVRNGVDIEEVTAYRKPFKNDELTIGTVGRVSYQKNPKLFNSVARLFPDIKFVWVGSGDLEHTLSSPNIEVTGWKTREEVLSILNSFDVYIQTSLWEGLPIAILEAMALSKPVLATNVVGNKDAIVQMENGMLCESVEDFKDSIEKLMAEPELLGSMGASSIQRVRELFDKNKNFDDLQAIYLKSLKA